MSNTTLSRLRLQQRFLVERRSEPRLPVRVQGLASIRGRTFPAQVHDLGQRGGAMVIDGSPSPAASEAILLTLPRPSGTLRIQAIVRHSQQTGPHGSNSFKLGVEFDRVARGIRWSSGLA